VEKSLGIIFTHPPIGTERAVKIIGTKRVIDKNPELIENRRRILAST